MDNENIRCKDNSMDKVEPTNKIIQREHCDLTTCEKLIYPRQRSSKWCPVSDPTPSTCAFLLRVKQCCNTRNCQLAAKICDLYAPLYNIEEAVSEGDPKYHYLLKDADTDMAPSEIAIEVIPELDPEPIVEELTSEYIIEELESIQSLGKCIPPVEVQPASSLSDILSEVELPLSPPAPPSVIENARVPSEEEFEYPAPTTDTRTSVVSWDVRASRAVRRSSASQEKVINRAKQEVNQLRMKGTDRMIFGENARKNFFAQSKERVSAEQLPEDNNLKSRLETVSLHDSTHSQKCCASLRRKSRKKKKQEAVREDVSGSIIWHAPEDQEKRKPKLSNTPVQEKKQQINTMLSKM